MSRYCVPVRKNAKKEIGTFHRGTSVSLLICITAVHPFVRINEKNPNLTLHPTRGFLLKWSSSTMLNVFCGTSFSSCIGSQILFRLGVSRRPITDTIKAKTEAKEAGGIFLKCITDRIHHRPSRFEDQCTFGEGPYLTACKNVPPYTAP